MTVHQEGDCRHPCLGIADSVLAKSDMALIWHLSVFYMLTFDVQKECASNKDNSTRLSGPSKLFSTGRSSMKTRV